MDARPAEGPNKNKGQKTTFALVKEIILGKDDRLPDDNLTFKETVKDLLYGIALHDVMRNITRNKSALEHLFILITLGDMLGVPILPPYYSLRILPFAVPHINNWKRRLLRPKDFLDALF